MNKLLVAASVVSVLSTFACTAGSGSLVDTCTGSYSCTDGTNTVSTTLEKSGGACTAGQLTLNSDGTVSGADNATWSGDSQQFQVCSDGACFTCTSTSSSASSGTCTGTAEKCGAQIPPDCEEMEMGCTLYEDDCPNFECGSSCIGTPVPCSDPIMQSEAYCTRQPGCTWTP